MSDVTLPRPTFQHIERVLNEIRIKLRREELESSVNEKKLMEFMGYTNKKSVDAAIRDGRIPKDAYIILTNSKRRYFLNKLIK